MAHEKNEKGGMKRHVGYIEQRRSIQEFNVGNNNVTRYVSGRCIRLINLCHKNSLNNFMKATYTHAIYMSMQRMFARVCKNQKS